LKLYQIQNKIRLLNESDRTNQDIINIYISDYLSIWDMDLSRWEKIKTQEKHKAS
ncbi:DUF4231 domain-containing protein, partial [Salmonella enterica]|nr:DUF4231 domain-containing protein [Salmonella enterica]